MALADSGRPFLKRGAVWNLSRMGTPEAARALAEVYIRAVDQGARDMAEQALGSLTGQPAIDAACDLAIATGDRRLLELLDGAGHLPSDPGRRTVWLFLVGRFDQAAELDFDGSLLRAATGGADPGLRRRIAEQARVGGRTEWIRAMVTESPGDLAGLSDEEWQATTGMLSATGRLDELWRLVPRVPLPRAAQILCELGRRGWRPGADGTAFTGLLRLARRCAAEPLSAICLFGEARVLVQRDPSVPSQVAANGPHDLIAHVGPSAPRGRLWRLPSGEPAGEFPVRETTVSALAVARDGSAVAVAGYDGSVRVQSLSDDSSFISMKTWMLTGGNRCDSLLFTPDGELLAGASREGGVCVWHTRSGKLLGVTSVHRSYDAYLAVTPDGRLLVIAGWSRRPRGAMRIQVRRLPSGVPSGEVDCDPLNAMTVTPDGQHLVTVGPNAVHTRELPSLRTVTTWNGPVGGDIAVSADGGLVSGAFDGRFEVRRAADGGPLARLGQPVAEPAISPDNRLLAGIAGYSVNIWHLPSGARAGALREELAGNPMLMFGAGNAIIARTGSSNLERLLLWRPEPALAGDIPVGAVPLADAERLRDRTRYGPDRPWGELLAKLVHGWHRHDITLSDTTPATSGTDIEVTE